MKLSVVIPCYNAAETIGIQLNALANQSWTEPWEIIVVNNRSTDNSMKIVKEFRRRLPNLHITEASIRQGAPHAINVGVRLARGETLAFCDADDEVDEGWLAAMGEALSKYDFVACRVDTEKLSPGWVIDSLGLRFQSEGLSKIWYPPYLTHAGGGTIGVKRALYQAVGGFDEFFPYCYETDFCFKLQLAGVELHFAPDALTHVRLRDKVSNIFHQANHWAEYNVKLYKKYRTLTGTEIPQPWRRHFASWKGLIWKIPKLRNKMDLTRFMWALGWQVGFLRGSIKYRVPPLTR